MKLTNFQQEYLLELLSGEYFPQNEQCSAVREAIKHFQSTEYSLEELEILASLPQSLTADLYLSRRKSLQHFAARFAVWLNTLEYNIFDDDPALVAYLVNPDSSSIAKILRLSQTDDGYLCTDAKPIYFTSAARSCAEITAAMRENPFTSVWEYAEVEYLFREFLHFANQNPAKIPEAHHDYLLSLEDNLNRTKEHRLSWSELREKAREFPSIGSDYAFIDRSRGLITPSTLQILSLLNSKPVKNIVKRITRPQAPLAPLSAENGLFGKLKNTLKNSLPHPTPHYNAPQLRPQFSAPPRPHLTKKTPFFAAPSRKHRPAPPNRKHYRQNEPTAANATSSTPTDEITAPEVASEPLIITDPAPALAVIAPAAEESDNNIYYTPLNY